MMGVAIMTNAHNTIPVRLMLEIRSLMELRINWWLMMLCFSSFLFNSVSCCRNSSNSSNQISRSIISIVLLV